MFLQSSTLAAARVGFDRIFQEGYQAITQADLWWMQLATARPSTDKSNIYHLLKLMPRMRKWVGARILHNLSMADYSLVNEPYEDGFEIDVDDFEDDKLGIYDDALRQMGRAAALWGNDIIYTALINGGTQLCYDGQYFFDTDHPLVVEGSADDVQVNLHTTTALTAANYATTYQTMIARKGEDGKPMNIVPNLLIVPPTLKFTALRIVKAVNAGYLMNASSTAADDNILRGTAEVLVIPELETDSSSTWYLADTSKPVKPFIFQQRRMPNRIDVLNKPTDSNVFNERVVKVGCDGRGAAGYALWQLCDKCTA